MICLIKDIPIYYEQYGDDNGTPVLCIHGYGADHRIMTGCLEPVFSLETEYRRIYLDLPGMGRSPAAACIKSADDMLSVIIDFIHMVITQDNFLLIGESYGGYLSLGLMHKLAWQIDGAMLICPVIAADNVYRKLPPKYEPPIPDDFAPLENEEVKAFLEMAVVVSDETFERYRRDISPVSGLPNGDEEYLAEYRSSGYAFSFENALRNIAFNKPVSILTGRQDSVVGYLSHLSFSAAFRMQASPFLTAVGIISSLKIYLSLISTSWTGYVALIVNSIIKGEKYVHT